VELARKTLGSLSGRNVMIVGAGKAGELSAKALLAAGASHVLIANRTDARSKDLAQDIGGTAIPLSSLPVKLAEVDVVITGTGAREPVITAQAVRSAVALRNGAPLLLVDIAMPRDVEPSVAAIPGVYLYNMEQLQEVAQANLRQRHTEASKVDSIVDTTTDRLTSWWRSQSALPTIKDLGDTAETVRQQEVGRALRKLPHLSDDDVQTVEKMSQAIVKKLLHHPLLSLKETPEDSEFAAALRRAFNLRKEHQDGST
jgi:glutamyl-tRNA reductase